MSDTKKDGTPTVLPVLIVGAGAAGTMLALELARRGIDYRLVDRLPQPAPHSRAITVHARTLEIFERIDPELLSRYLKLGRHSPGYVMHYVDQDGARREMRPGLDFRSLPSRYPFLLLNGQHDTEALMRNYLDERYAIKPQWGVNCSKVELMRDAVLATLTHEGGKEETVQTRYLVACDGANSGVRKQLGLIQEGSDYAGTVLQNLDVEIPSFPDDTDWVHYCMGPGHFVMVVKLPSGYFRLLMSQPVDHADAEATPHEVFGEILARHFDGLSFGRTAWHSRWQSFNRLAEHYRKGNVFLAGDAAHIHSTAGGQGMNCCMQDAYNLGWKLALVLREQAHPSLLDSYEDERKPIGEQVIGVASEIHELFMAGRDSSPEDVLALQKSGALPSLINQVSGLAYHYRHYRPENAALNMENPGLPQPGDRAPDALLPGAQDQRVYHFTYHPKFTLLAAMPEGAEMDEAGTIVNAIQADYPQLLEAAVMAPAPVAYIGHSQVPLLYLLRPDGYIALCNKLSESTLVIEWLQKMVNGH